MKRARKAHRPAGWLPVLVSTVSVTGVCLLWEILLIPGIVVLAALGTYLLMTGIYLGRIGDLQPKSFATQAGYQAVGNQRTFLAIIVLVGILTLGIALSEKGLT